MRRTLHLQFRLLSVAESVRWLAVPWFGAMFLFLGAVQFGHADEPKDAGKFFNGKALTGWTGTDGYWSVKERAIVGQSAKPIPRNEFIWSNIEMKDFYLSVDVMLEPDSGNGGIQFRSKKIGEHTQALGYQADVGKGIWGRLYHEHGRGELDWTDRGEKAVKPGEWNHYEILAAGPRIWTAINGRLSVAPYDPKGERSGYIAMPMHSGHPQTRSYRLKNL